MANKYYELSNLSFFQINLSNKKGLNVVILERDFRLYCYLWIK